MSIYTALRYVEQTAGFIYYSSNSGKSITKKKEKIAFFDLIISQGTSSTSFKSLYVLYKTVICE